MTLARWDGGGWDGCYDGEALAEVLSVVTKCEWRFIGEGERGELVFDRPGEERSIVPIPICGLGQLLFKVAACVPLKAVNREREEEDTMGKSKAKTAAGKRRFVVKVAKQATQGKPYSGSPEGTVATNPQLKISAPMYEAGLTKKKPKRKKK
jgi:hypothetical protein